MKPVRLASALSAIALGALAQFGGIAYAAPCATHPSGGDALIAGSPGDVDTTDMTFRGNAADGCSALYDGNNSAAEVGTVALALGTVLDPLQPEIKSDNAGTTDTELYDGIQWSLTFEVSSDPNTWRLSYAANPDVSRTYDVIAVMKQSIGWAVFRFADEPFVTDGSGSGSFLIDWCGGQGNFSFNCTSDALSHLSVYLERTGDTQLPEPGGLALVALGLVGLALTRRRRTV